MPVTLFIDGIEASVTGADLDQVFGPFHPSRIILATHRSGTSLGFAFVLFEDEDRASQAVAQLNGTSFAGRRISISRSICPAALEEGS